MQDWDKILYPSFRAAIRGEYYGMITQDDLDEECYYLACRAIATFKFPKVSLDYETFYAEKLDDELIESTEEEGIPHGRFINNVGFNEIEVILAWMKVYWIENMLSNSDNFSDLYTDANIKTFSRANLIDKNTNVLKDARIAAHNAESRYSRVSSTRQPKIGDINNE